MGEGAYRLRAAAAAALTRAGRAQARALVMRWLATIADVNTQFRQMDLNGDGVLTMQELQQVIAPFGAQWAGLPEALMVMGDRDGNGCLDLREFHQFGLLLQANTALQGLYGAQGPVFAQLSAAQQRDLVMRWLQTFPDPDAEFFLIDTNHDGELDRLQASFLAGLRSSHRWRGVPAPGRRGALGCSDLGKPNA